MRLRPSGATLFAELVFATLLGACGATQTVDREVTVEPPADAEYDSAAFAGYLGAVVAERRGDAVLAAELIAAAVEGGPDDAFLRAEQVRLFTAAGRLDEAERSLRIAGSLGVEPWKFAMLRAGIDEARGDFAAALADFSGVDPAGAPESFYLAWMGVAARANATDERVRAAMVWTTNAPDAARAWRSLGAAQRDAGAPTEAAAAYANASRATGGDPWDAEQRIGVLLDAGDVAAAQEAAADCREQFRSHVPCVALQVLALAEAGGPGAAAEPVLDELAGLTSGDRRAVGRYADGFTAAARPDLATAFTLRVAALRPQNTAILTAAAWASARAGDETLAIELMLRVIAVDESNFDALNYVGYAWAEQGRNLDQAEVMLRRAVDLRPDDGNIRDSLAWAFYRQGRYDEALVEQLRAVSDSPENAVLFDHLGDMYYALERRGEAIEAWENAIRFADPYSEDVLETVPPKIDRARLELAN